MNLPPCPEPIVFSPPMFAPLMPWLARLPAGRFPHHEELNRLAGNGEFRFVAADGALRHYELHIHEAGEIPTRADNWHDLFNALVWCAFPQAKRALNRRHVVAMPESRPGRRGPERDFLTVLDESGALAVCRDPELVALWREHRWQELFVDRRDAFRRGLRVVLFGHASYEQSLDPFLGMTAKALLLPEGLFEAPLSDWDRWLAERLLAGDWRGLKAASLALPFLGVPGWYPANEDPAFYRNTGYFRPRPAVG